MTDDGSQVKRVAGLAVRMETWLRDEEATSGPARLIGTIRRRTTRAEALDQGPGRQALEGAKACNGR